MQMLGLAGVFVLLPPLFWALQLLTRRAAAQPARQARAGAAGGAVHRRRPLLAAQGSAWPLHHGYGGLLGDLGLGLLTSLLGHVNPDRSGCRGRAVLLCRRADGADVEPRPDPARPQADLPGQRAAKARRLNAMAGWSCASGSDLARRAAPAGAGRTGSGLDPRAADVSRDSQPPVEEAPVARCARPR